MPKQIVSAIKDLKPVFLVAVGVTIAGTLAGAEYDKVHRVAAEQPNFPIIQAVGAGQSQTLAIKQWGLTLTSPLATEMPLLSYAAQSPDSIGLTSADLVKQGPNCSAAQNALGEMVREPAGQYAKSNAQPGTSVVLTTDQYEYIYRLPSGACANTTAGMTTVNREESVLLEAMGSLAPAQ